MALQSYQTAVIHHPSYLEALNNIGVYYKNKGMCTIDYGDQLSRSNQ